MSNLSQFVLPAKLACMKAKEGSLSEDVIRDICDLKSGGEMDCTQLDILCGMVKAELVKNGSIEP